MAKRLKKKNEKNPCSNCAQPISQVDFGYPKPKIQVPEAITNTYMMAVTLQYLRTTYC